MLENPLTDEPSCRAGVSKLAGLGTTISQGLIRHALVWTKVLHGIPTAACDTCSVCP
jgi:hypothetical protein